MDEGHRDRQSDTPKDRQNRQMSMNYVLFFRQKSCDISAVATLRIGLENV